MPDHSGSLTPILPVENDLVEAAAPVNDPEIVLPVSSEQLSQPEQELISIASQAGDSPAQPKARPEIALAADNLTQHELPRSSLRAAITSNRQFSKTSSNYSPQLIQHQPADLERAAEVQSLIARGQMLARQRQLDAARSLISRALQLEPTNAEAWTWLGGLMIDLNLERARLCLKRGLDLDPANERARRGLTYVDEKLQSRGGPVHPDRQMVLAQVEDTVRPVIKIGMEEIVESMRQSGLEPEPHNIPLGGARYRPAIEKGELVMPRVRRRRFRFRIGWPAGAKSRWSRRFFLLMFAVVVVSFISSLFFLYNSASNRLPVENSSGTIAISTPVLSPDESFTARLRYEIGSYNRYLATTRNLRQEVQHGHINWEEYRRNIKNLQSEIRNQKKEVDGLALSATPRLVVLYRELQSIAGLTQLAADNINEGIENTNPENLEESNRQFQEATRRLAELARNMNSVAPMPVTITNVGQPTAEATFSSGAPPPVEPSRPPALPGTLTPGLPLQISVLPAATTSATTATPEPDTIAPAGN